jgi:carbonic anhydrase
MKDETIWLVALIGCSFLVAPLVAQDKKPAAEHPYFHNEEQAKPHAAEWSYAGKTGPAHWGELSPEYLLAKTGKSQSPIDIHDVQSTGLPKIEFAYRPSQIRLVYNGHSIQENEDPGGFALANDKQFELEQLHFHAPSEHTIVGQHFPLEMHLVHRAKDGTSGVVAVFINEGEHNKAFDPIWSNLPDANRPKQDVEITIDASLLLPKDTNYYLYDGSFTTPPCTEQVKWVILANPVNLSKQQIAQFGAIIHDNNRPLQPLNGRQVLRAQESK